MSSGYGTRGPLVRLAYLAVASVWWVFTGFGRRGRGKSVVLCYHGVLDAQRERFRRQMDRVAARGERGPRVVLTFDDAFACLLDNALPVTDDLGLDVTVFAVTDNLGGTPAWDIDPGHPEAVEALMTADQVATAARSEHVRFGSHTATHPRLTDLGPERLERELVDSRRALQDLLGTPVDELALPHGACDDGVMRAAAAAGYRRVHTLEHRCQPDPLDEGAVGRFTMSPDVWWLEFVLTIDGAYGWLGSFRGWVRGRRGGSVATPSSRAGAVVG